MNFKIEFLGFPGSGKTKLSKYFEKKFIKSNLQFKKSDKYFFEFFSKDKIDNLLFKLFYLYKTNKKFKSKKLFKKQYIFLNKKIDSIIKKKKLGKIVDNFESLLNHTDLNIDGKLRSLDNFKIDLCSYYLNDRKNSQIIYYDEGLIQRVFQNYIIKKNFLEIKKKIFKYLRSIPYPDTVIKIDVSIKKSFDNTTKRKKGFTYNKSFKQIKKIYLEIDQILYEFLTEKKKIKLFNFKYKKINIDLINKIVNNF